MATEIWILGEILSERENLKQVKATYPGTVKGMMASDSGTLNGMMTTASDDFPLMMARKVGRLV